jgi:mannose-1-phosphate guanylyltransferase/phosphomannomutase
MLKAGEKIYGFPAEGYWCDVGDSEAYLRCCFEC